MYSPDSIMQYNQADIDMNEKRNNPGGSGGAGGWSFQARVTAYVAINILARQSLGWLRSQRDVPVVAKPESGGAGDDLRLHLEGGKLVEVQVKKHARNDSSTWDALLRLAQGLKREPELVGVLVVGPSSGKKIRENLRRDLERLSEGRKDHLKPISARFLQLLEEASVDPGSVIKRLHIVSLDLEDESPSLGNALELLSRQISNPRLSGAAWGVLADKGLRLAASRGGMCGSTLEAELNKAGIDVSKDVANMSALLSRYSRWNRDRYACIHVPSLGLELPIEKSWPDLKCIQEDPREGLLSDPDTSRSTQRNKVADAFSMVLYNQHCVVIGGPGSGKTTLLRKITQQQSMNDDCVLHVELQSVAKAMEAGKSFENALLEVAADGFETPDAAALLATPTCLIADGLDECGLQRGIVAESLLKWSLGHSGSRVIVSTRSDAYVPAGFFEWTHLRLQPLETHEIEEFTRCLLTELCPNDADRSKLELRQLLASWKELKTLDVAAPSPLILTFLLRLSLAKEAIPGTRGQLYQRILSLLEDAELHGRPQLEIRKPPFTRPALGILGYVSHALTADSSLEVLDQAAAILQDEAKLTRVQAVQIIQDAVFFWREKRVLVVPGTQIEAWSFVHPTFEEYAAAEFIAKLDEDKLNALVNEHAHSMDWSTELLFASEIGASSAICASLVSVGQGSLLSDTPALAVRCFSLEFANETARASIQAVVRERLQSDIPVICYEIAAASLENPDATSILAPIAKALCESEQYWTKLCAAMICLESDDSLPAQALVEALYEKVGTAEDTWPWIFRNWQTAWGYKSQVENRFIQTATRFLLDNAAGPETYERVLGKLLAGEISIGAIEGIVTILREKGLGDVLERSKYWAKRKEFWAETTIRLAGTSDERCITTDANLLDAVLTVCAGEGITPSEAFDSGHPFLSLGALFSASKLGELTLPEFVEIGRLADRRPLAEVLRGAIRAAQIDLQELADDASQAINALASDPQPLFFLLPRLTCKADWDRVAEAQFDVELVLEALHSESWYVAYLACCIVASGGCPSISGDKALTILDAGDYGLWSASVLADELWGEDAFAAIFQRLSGQLTDDCRYLFERIPELMPEKADPSEIVQLLVRGIRHGEASVAVSAAEALEKIESHAPTEREVRELLLYWKEQEAPYPANDGFIPPSPRASLLRELSGMIRMSIEEALEWLKDNRGDVTGVALSIVKARLEEEPADVEPLLQQICQEGEPLSLLKAAQDLPNSVLISAKEVLLGLFSSRHAFVRRRMLEALPAPWLSREEAISLSEKHMADEDPCVRSTALLARRRLNGISRKSN